MSVTQTLYDQMNIQKELLIIPDKFQILKTENGIIQFLLPLCVELPQISYVVFSSWMFSALAICSGGGFRSFEQMGAVSPFSGRNDGLEFPAYVYDEGQRLRELTHYSGEENQYFPCRLWLLEVHCLYWYILIIWKLKQVCTSIRKHFWSYLRLSWTLNKLVGLNINGQSFGVIQFTVRTQ